MEEKDIRIGIEKRRYVRLYIRLKARFKVEGDPEEKIYEAMTRNINRGGLCLEVTKNIKEIKDIFNQGNPRLNIALDLPGIDETVETAARPVWISTRVGWMEPPVEDRLPLFLGMAFVNLPPSEKERIDTYLANKLLEKYQEDRGK
jgi:hypothetical protein